MPVQNAKAALCCQMFGWILRMLLSTRAIREYCLALWRQVPFKRHWMFLLSLKVKKPLIWSAIFWFLFHFFFPLACQGLGGVSWPGEQQWPLIERSPSLCHTQGRASSFFLRDFMAYLSASTLLPMVWHVLLPYGPDAGPILLFVLFQRSKLFFNFFFTGNQHFLLRCCMLFC